MLPGNSVDPDFTVGDTIRARFLGVANAIATQDSRCPLFVVIDDGDERVRHLADRGVGRGSPQQDSKGLDALGLAVVEDADRERLHFLPGRNHLQRP